MISIQMEDDSEHLLLALLDSGTTRSLTTNKAVQKTKLTTKANQYTHTYRTTIGVFQTNEYTTIQKHKIVGL